MFDWWQRFVFESIPNPPLAALLSGFAVIVWGEMVMTPAGERYLAEKKCPTF